VRYFIHLSYKGTHYHGWQRQNNAPTVQAEIEDKISLLLKAPIEILGCGRTDTGVHAHSIPKFFSVLVVKYSL
jgi:tRNA pseudouridine38-40 synthase